MDTRTKCKLVAFGVAVNGQPFAVTTAPGWPMRQRNQPRPADWPSDEEIDAMGGTPWPESADARDDAQHTPTQEELQ